MRIFERYPCVSLFQSVFGLLAVFALAGHAHSKEMLHLNPKHSAAAYLSCLANQHITLVTAHRGGPLPRYPENALETLQHTLAHGAMLLEVDVRETADGQLFLLHDNDLARTTSGTGEANAYTLPQLKTLTLKDNQGLPTAFTVSSLKEVLDWIDEKAIVQLDIKRGVDIAKVARAVVDADAVDSVLLIAYSIDDALRALSVDKSFSFSFSINSDEDIVNMEKAGIAKEQIVAWTGVADNTPKPIWPKLESLGLPMAAGAFWNLEKDIQASGNTQPYLDLKQSGVDVIASDHYPLAYDTLANSQDLTAALSQCKDQ